MRRGVAAAGEVCGVGVGVGVGEAGFWVGGGGGADGRDGSGGGECVRRGWGRWRDGKGSGIFGVGDLFVGSDGEEGWWWCGWTKCGVGIVTEKCEGRFLTV